MIYLIIALIIWVIGIVVDCCTTTEENFEWHKDNSIFGGWTSHTNRDLLPHDVRLAMIWPLRTIWGMIMAGIWMFNDVAAGFFLLFGFKYKDTDLYNWVDTKTNG